jgi:hypothetical protein
MTQTQAALSHRIKILESELQAALDEKEREFQYSWVGGRARFGDSTLAEHRKLKQWLPSYIRDSRFLVILTAPVIYAVFIPFALLDLFVTVYQTICFPIYGVPKVKRSDYIVYDRAHLKYLNLVERLNCLYCSYGNGVCGYATEISARTEQHWCPIKHARRLRAPHSRYTHFFDYGDAAQYSKKIETVRADFVDVRDVAPAESPRDTIQGS